ncbi:MAG: hypothetical protein QXW01_03795 [Candidatus Aenigmatarchaeota archaeon]
MNSPIRRFFSLKKTIAVSIPTRLVKEMKIKPNDICLVRKVSSRVLEIIILKHTEEALYEAEKIKQEFEQAS